MNASDDAAARFYADPANCVPHGPGVRRRAPHLTATVPVRFGPEVIGQVRELAFAEGITVSAWIRRAVAREMERAT